MRIRSVSVFAVWVAAVVFLGFVSAKRLNAQILYGSVAGTVADQSGAVVPSATVSIVNDNTGFTRNTVTGSSGEYRITDLPAGPYTLAVEAKGFKPVKITGIRVVVGVVNQQNVQLTVGAVTQQVTVSAPVAVLQTQQANVHTTISNYAVQNLPLNVYHNFQSVELLTPGVVSLSAITNSYPNAYDGFEKSFAINTNGLPQHINTTRVDGATNIFLWLPDHMLITPPASTVEEVNVQTANYNVQKGLTAGAATDVITKSGTNQLHGSVYGYHTDQAMNAQNALVHVASKPKNIQNNFGVTLGGPIKKDKLFFFGNWDGSYQRQAIADTNLIPPTDMRNGDYSAYLGAPLYDSAGNPVMVCSSNSSGAGAGPMVQLQEGMVFDPTTGNALTGQGRCAFQNNIIPTNRIYAGATNFWQLMDPYTPNNTLGQPFTQFTAQNDIRLINQIWNRNIYTGKVDYNISDRQTLWGKYTLQRGYLNLGSDYGIAGLGGGRGVLSETAQIVTMAHTWTVNPDLVLTGHAGFLRMGMSEEPPDYGKDYGQSVLGLVNSNTPAGDPRYGGMPGLILGGGFTNLGNAISFDPEHRHDWTLTLDENGSWMKGKHAVVFGFDAAHNHMNQWQPEIVCCPRGAITAAGDNTFLNTATDAAGIGTQAQYYDSTGAPLGFNSAPWNNIAEFNLGLASLVQNGQQYINATNKDWQEALYVGDTYRITSKFTIDAGLRWEYFPMITRDGVSKFEVYDVSTNQLVLGGLGNNPIHPLGVTSSKKLFAPRLGIAYQLDNKTVIRSAFGIAYDTLPLERPLRGFYPYTIGETGQVTGNSKVTRFLPYATFNNGTNAVNAIPGLAEGVPLIATPTGFYSGAITPPNGVEVGTMNPGAFKRGYVESWNFTVQRRLPSDILLNVGYVGNHLVHQFNGHEANAGPLGEGSAGQPLFAPYGRYAHSWLFQGYLDSHYNSLQISLDRHVTHGLFLQGSYTYSKVIGFMDDEGWENGLYFNCTPNVLMPNGCQALNRHTLSFDHTHVLKMAYVYNLPFGSGQKWANTNKTARAVLGGWQLNGIITAISGSPLYPSQTASYLNTPFTSQVPDFSGNLQMLKATGPGQTWFNTTALTPVQTVRIGNSGRGLSWLRGPGLSQMDLSLFRNFKITERYRLRMRFEMLNFSNTPHWNNPNTTCSIVNGVCGGSLGQITGSFGQRIFQVGAEVDF
jgi:hypothetical protein